MTGEPGGGGLAWNVAGLLADESGARRSYTVDDVRIDLPEGLALSAPLAGDVTLTRTNRGILARGTLVGALGAECSRCLRSISVPLELAIEEEYLPSLDLTTGRPLPLTDEPDVARLDDHHELDLEPAVRDAVILAEPIAPLCRPDCPGLCIVCGGRLDDGPHDHPDDDIDPRLEVLRGFRTDDA